jgi:DNA-directed RNA polymerase subunit H (RpoH/RPB5)
MKRIRPEILVPPSEEFVDEELKKKFEEIEIETEELPEHLQR